MMTMIYNFFYYINADNYILIMLYQILNVSCTCYYILYILRKVGSKYNICIITNTMCRIWHHSPYVNDAYMWIVQLKFYNHVFISKTLKVVKITAIKFVDAQNAATAANPKPISPSRSSGWSHWFKINKQQLRYGSGRETRRMGVEGETHNILNRLKNSKGSWRFRTFSRSLHNKRNTIPSPCEMSKMEVKNQKHKRYKHF